MEKYDYKAAMVNDIINYINDNDILDYEFESPTDLHDYLNDELWDKDEITGNGSYYYANADKCENYLAGNLRLAIIAIQDFGLLSLDSIPEDENTILQFLDCTIRCYLLWECIWEALKTFGIEKDYD